MGVCLSCHRRKGRSSEKKKSDVQLCQSLAPLHDCVGECGKVLSDQKAIGASGESGEKNSINRASVVTSAISASPYSHPYPCVSSRVYSLHSSLSDDPSSDINLCSGKLENSACNGTRKRTISSYNENIDSFNKFYNDNSNGKHALTLSNGHNIVSISNKNKKDNSCSSTCDSLSTDLINVKTCSRDSVTMANTISNMKMTNPLKGLVSKQKKRYVEGGFNLDLTYITQNIIAMGFPAEKMEAIYRNDIEDVARFLEDRHKDHYKIYNLCSERSYDQSKFHERVSAYPFDDHNPPKIDLIRSFCEDMHEWLSANQENVAAVHCKAGKGRTGTMICCYLLHEGQFRTAADALNFYGQKRTHNLKGVTIPSQRRYVEYYAALLGMLGQECVGAESPVTPIGYRPPALLILELLMKPPPALNGGQSTLEFCVSELNHSSQKVSLGCHEVRKGSTNILMRLDRCTPLVGDIKVEVYNTKPKIKMRKEKLFHFWFNTFFVTHEVNAVREDTLDQDGTLITTFRLTFNKWQLDDAHKDKQNKTYSPDFMVQLLVQRVPESSAWGRGSATGPRGSPPSHSHSSSADEDDSEDSLEPEEGWDSGEARRLSLCPPARMPSRSVAASRRLSTPNLSPHPFH